MKWAENGPPTASTIGVEMQQDGRRIGVRALSVAVTLGLTAATLAAGASTAHGAPSSRCNITVRTLRGRFSGIVSRSVPTSCPLARKVAETSLRTIIRSGGTGSGHFSTRASSAPTRPYRLRCAATGNLYMRRGISVDCRAGALAGGRGVRVLYRAVAALILSPRYLDYAREPLESYTHIGPQGVPLFNIGGKWVEHPDGVAQWGLREYAYGHRRPLMTAASWFAAHQRPDGGFPYKFDVDADGVPMLAPWISALAQGQAISVLARAYLLSGSPRYLRAALRAINPFLHRVPAGLTSAWGGRHWYEEYPAAHPEHVLDGFMFALVGLHELAPRSPTAWRLWRAGVRGLTRHVASFDVPGKRTMLYAAVGGGRYLAPPYYRQIDAVLLRTIARWTDNRRLRVYAHRWTMYTR